MVGPARPEKRNEEVALRQRGGWLSLQAGPRSSALCWVTACAAKKLCQVAAHPPSLKRQGSNRDHHQKPARQPLPTLIKHLQLTHCDIDDLAGHRRHAHDSATWAMHGNCTLLATPDKDEGRARCAPCIQQPDS